MHVGGRLGVITIHHKGRFLISHTLISFCLQIAFQSPVMCVRGCARSFVCTHKHKCNYTSHCKNNKKKNLQSETFQISDVNN